jgi:alkyl hydroperoxide reductase subunit D
MNELEKLRALLPEPAKDVKLNLQSVFQTTTLTPAQLWGVAVASSLATRHAELARAALADARAQEVDEAVIADAQAAAALMAMNNVYYRFRHMIGKESYATKPARLRMNWMVNPRSNRADFELFSTAVSAVNGCEMCLRSHEDVITQHGLTEDQVHDAVRGAATLQAVAVSLEMAALNEQTNAAAG